MQLKRMRKVSSSQPNLLEIQPPKDVIIGYESSEELEEKENLKFFKKFSFAIVFFTFILLNIIIVCFFNKLYSKR